LKFFEKFAKGLDWNLKKHILLLFIDKKIDENLIIKDRDITFFKFVLANKT